jgi:molecular chaperone Hsp33
MNAFVAQEEDVAQPFRLEKTDLRGRLVRLGDTVDTVLTQHAYPEPVSRLLAELLVLAATLAGALKFSGVFSLQSRGDGPVSLMVADCTNAGELRAFAQFDAGRVADAAAQLEAGGAEVPALLGSGYLALTVDQGPDTERYQGIVELEGATLTDCMHNYFRRSEQLATGLRVAVERDAGASDGEDIGGGRWRAGALMLQAMPEGSARVEEREDGWRRALLLMGTATRREILDPALPATTLLYRLFHEDGVRVYKPLPLAFGCRCSRERVEMVLRALTDEQVAEMKDEQDRIVATCQFCSRDYTFVEREVAELRAASTH